MKPSQLEFVNEAVQSVLLEKNFAPDILSPAIAYTYTRANTLCGTIYRVFINNKDEEFAQFLFIHECGHIIFGHCKNVDAKMSLYLEEKMRAGYKKLNRVIGRSSQKWFEIFQSTLLNIVMDFEVNSRLFSPDEWDFMNNKLNEFHKTQGMKGMWPQDYGFEPGLTWNEYLTQILFDSDTLKKFFKQFRMQTLMKLSQSGLNSSISQEEYEEYKKKCQEQVEANKTMTDEERDALEKYSKKHDSASFCPPNGLMNSRSSKKAEPVQINFTKYNSMVDLYAKLAKLLRLETKSFTRRDMMYNYNRRKINSNVIVPKDVRYERHVSRKLYILLDVSGSVDAQMVYDFCTTFCQMNRDFKDIRFVSWNTHLVGEWGYTEPMCNHYGGGTCLARGIRYVQEHFTLTPKDAFFVISDFCDDLPEWEEALKSVRAEKYAINWNPDVPVMNPGFKTILTR